MDMNSKTKITMDLVRLETEVRQKAKEYLDDITEDNLKAFAESTKYIAQSVLENFILSVDDLFTNGALKICDNGIYNRFSDFHDGYRAQMKKWAKENEIIIREMKVSPTLMNLEPESEGIIKKPLVIAGIGTLIAVGLFIFTETWIAVAAELLVLGVATYIYKQSNESRDQEHAFKVKKYEMQIEQEKALLVDGLIKDLKKWLDNAEQFSENVISKFGV
ncbi:MAG: hypothetical protein IK004_10210 [Bacteroidales bacterium]|nr:hypothetical protein [Bacteroidales bacterium]